MSSNTVRAFAATGPKADLTPFEFELGPIGPEQVEIAVTHCGICHSDLSMLDNEWGMSAYPLVAGHEVVGKIIAVGERVSRRAIGQTVGLGWFSQSCMGCPTCMGGDHNMCATAEQTIVGRHGGFAERVRAHWSWAAPVPEGVDPAKAGPLFCGGITVFNPIVQCGVRPTDRVGVVGIGGLGHMAVQFLQKWGCEVYAFTSSQAKREEALALGAHGTLSSRGGPEWTKMAASFDFILSTVNVPLDWNAYISLLAPRGRLHTVGAVLEPMAVSAFPLIMGQKSVSGSPLGSPVNTARMLDFCARHQIAPVTETFPMSKINDALARLRSGEARYRVVLENDLH